MYTNYVARRKILGSKGVRLERRSNDELYRNIRHLGRNKTQKGKICWPCDQDGYGQIKQKSLGIIGENETKDGN